MGENTKLNSCLWCIAIFIQYLLLPIKIFHSTTLLEILIIGIIVSISIYYNGIKVMFIKVFCTTSLIYLIDYLVFRKVETITFFYFGMFSSSLLIFFFTLYLNNIKEFFEVYYKFSIVTLISVILYLFLSSKYNVTVVSYMAIGNILTFICIPIIYQIYVGKKQARGNVILIYFILIFALFFSNRMAIVTIYLIYLIPKFFFINSQEKLLKEFLAISVQLILFLVLLFNIQSIISSINIFLSNSDMAFYSLIKLERMLTNSDGLKEGFLSASSGRDSLYLKALEIIKSNNFFPSGISGFEYIDYAGNITRYPHNFLLELLVSFSLFGLFIPIVFIVIFIKKYVISSLDMKFLLLSFFIFSISKLLVSSSFWLSPSLWVCIGLLFIVSKNKKGELIN